MASAGRGGGREFPLGLLALLAAGGLAALGARLWLPLAAGDPLASTLRLVPLLLASLYGLHRWGVRRGARRLASGGSAGELAATGALVLAAFAVPTAGLGYAAEAVAAGLALVLAHRVGRQVIALRPLLGRELGPRPSALFFWLPFVVYVAILPWSAGHRQPDGDEPYNLLVTHSLAYDGDIDLANNYAAGDWRRFMDHAIAPQPGDPVGRHGQVYSRHDSLLPLVLAPAYRAAGKTGAQLVMALLTAALAWLTLRLARHYGARPGPALLAYACVAFTPPLLLYSYQIWVEVPAALLTLLALDEILALSAGSDAPSPRRTWLRIALPILLLPLLKIRFILIAVPLVALAGWQLWRRPALRRQVVALGVLLAALLGAILVYNQRLYSNPLKIHSWAEVDPHTHALADFFAGGLGLFYDAAFGLFAFAPLWLLLLPAAALPLARQLRPPRQPEHPMQPGQPRQPGQSTLLVHLAVLSVPYLLIVTPRGEWYGGWSPPFRYALIALPLLGIALAPLLACRHRPGARALLAGLGALTLVLTLAWLAVPGWTYNFADGRTYVLDHWSSRLGADLARFFPSSVRPRAATWLWPLLSMTLVIAIWWLPRRLAPRRLANTRALGIAAVLAAAALLPVAAAHLPTRVIEFEDPQVEKLGGHLYPDRWVVERTLYRGSWVLRVADQLRAPVVAGGRRVRLTLGAQLIRNQPVPYALDIAAGDRLLAVWTPVRDRAWTELSLGPFDWPAGAPLVLTAHGPSPPGALNGALLDRLDLRWE